MIYVICGVVVSVWLIAALYVIALCRSASKDSPAKMARSRSSHL